MYREATDIKYGLSNTSTKIVEIEIWFYFWKTFYQLIYVKFLIINILKFEMENFWIFKVV